MPVSDFNWWHEFPSASPLRRHRSPAQALHVFPESHVVEVEHAPGLMHQGAVIASDVSVGDLPPLGVECLSCARDAHHLGSSGERSQPSSPLLCRFCSGLSLSHMPVDHLKKARCEVAFCTHPSVGKFAIMGAFEALCSIFSSVEENSGLRTILLFMKSLSNSLSFSESSENRSVDCISRRPSASLGRTD